MSQNTVLDGMLFRNADLANEIGFRNFMHTANSCNGVITVQAMRQSSPCFKIM